MFIGSIFALPKMAEAAITYDTGSNTITVVGDASCGDSESNPCSFEDIYNADKAGTLTLVDRNGITGTDANPVDNTYNLRPADEKVLGGAKHDLYIVVENWNATSATVRLIGTNENDESLTEDINITGNGTYYTSELFKTLTQTQVTAFSGTSFDYELVQGQWGVVWKQKNREFYLNCRLWIGDGSTPTYFKTMQEVIEWGYNVIPFWMKSNATFVVGEKITQRGIDRGRKGSTFIFNKSSWNWYDFRTEPGSTLRLYDFHCTNIGTRGQVMTRFEGYVEAIDCSFSNLYAVRSYGDGSIWRHITSSGCYEGFGFWGAPAVLEDIVAFGNVFRSLYVSGEGTEIWNPSFLDSLQVRDSGGTAPVSYINADPEITTWQNGSGVHSYLKYTFDLKVVDKDGNPIKDASVKIWDKNNNLVTDVLTQDSGEIPQQKIMYKDIWYTTGHYISYNPFTIRISHQDYPSREFKVTIDKPIDWTIALKDKPMSVGSVKVWGTEYASDEPGTIYAQVFYGDGSPCNDIDPTDITATVYKSDGTKIIDGAQMTYVTGSNGIYKYDFPANTFSNEGVYIIDVMASSTDPNITAFNSNEIHISKSANLISQNLDQKISEVASSVWSYTGPALATTGNAISKIWSYTGSALDTTGNAIAKIWSYATRKLTSRQIRENEYIAGVSSSSTVSQVADQPTQENVEYNVELVRKATFDFAGFADSGSTTTLVDSELEGPDNYWQYYKIIFMSGDNFGQERVVTSYDADSHTLSWDSDNPLPYSVSAGDKYVLSHEHRLVYKIWSYTDRSLTSVGNIASAVWGWTTRSLTTRKIAENEYITGVSSSSTVSQVASSEQAENIQSSINNLQTDITYIRSKVDDIYSDTQYIRGKVDNILTKWSSYSAQDIMTDLDAIKSRIGASTDSSSEETLFGRTKYIQEKWGTQTAQSIYDTASSTLALVEDVQAELGYNGTSTTAYADLQLVKGYVDDLEGYVGTPSDDSSANTLFSRVKGVKEGTDKLIENIIVAEASVNDSNASTTQFITNLTNSTDDFYNNNVLVFTSGANAGQVRRITDYDGTLKKITIDPSLAEAPANNDTFSILSQTAVAGIDAQTIWTYGTRTLTAPDLDSGSLVTLSDLQKQWTVYLSDFGEILAGNIYRAKLWVLNYESVPTDAYATPTLTIYDAVRNKVVENVEMTKISTGIYEYTYSVPSSAVQGVWETDVSIEVESGKIIKRNDYWEVEGSPAQVKINSITDNTIPSISANVTISNEGSAGYEYQYEWCIVSSEDNACGGGDDIFYSSAAKYIQAGQDWNTTLDATVSSTGSYWFKVVVYYGAEKSGASQTFTAVEEEGVSPGGGGGVIISEKEKEKVTGIFCKIFPCSIINKILARLTDVEKRTDVLTANVVKLEQRIEELNKKVIKPLKAAPPQIIKERVVERRVVIRKPMPQVPRRRARIRLEGH